jgi:hypothetical protein
LDEKGAQRAPFSLVPFFRLLGSAFTLGCIESRSFGTAFLEIPNNDCRGSRNNSVSAEYPPGSPSCWLEGRVSPK